MKKAIIMLMGRSGSGKSHLERALIKAHPEEFHKVVSTTTRFPRKGEKDGVDYHFVGDDEFDNLDLVQTTFFNGNKYGSEFNQYTTEHTYVTLVVVPESAKKFKKVLNKRLPEAQIVCVYFDISANTLRDNMEKRGDTPDMISDRLRNDKLDEQFSQSGLVADFVVKDDMLKGELEPLFYDWLVKKTSRIYIHAEDLTGNKIQVGDIISYPVRKRSRMYMSLAIVRGIKYRIIPYKMKGVYKLRAVLKTLVAAKRNVRMYGSAEREDVVMMMKEDIDSWERSVVIPVANIHDYSDNIQMKKLAELRKKVLRGKKI